MICHILRYRFARRQVEAGVNLKVIQETLSHSDIKTTLNIYTYTTEELMNNEFDKLQEYLKEQYMQIKSNTSSHLYCDIISS